MADEKGKELKTTLVITGEMDETLKKAFDGATKALENLDKQNREALDAAGKLALSIQDQSDALKEAKRRYASYVLQGEEATEQAQELADEIKELAQGLAKSKTSYFNAEKAAESLAEGIDDVNDAAKKSKDGINTMDIALGNLVANGVTALISKASEAVQWVYGLAESTREYREDISKLETAFETNGHAVEQGTAVYKELFSVFGEEDRAVEAAQQIAALADSQYEMKKMTDIATGAWARWGDSLATESLMEAMNSTAKIGTVQGTLADALEWAGVNLDSFNDRLSKMTSEDERAAAIMSTLDVLYGKAAKNYRENNASIIESRRVQSDYTDSLAEFGEMIEPVTTSVTGGMSGLFQTIIGLMKDVDMQALSEKVTSSFESIGKAIEWVSENSNILLPLLSGVASALLAYTAMSKAQAAIDGFKSAISLLSSPMAGYALLIGAVIAAALLLYKNWDKVKEWAEDLGEKINAVWSRINDAVTGFIDNIGAKFPLLGGFLSGIWESVRAVWDNIRGIFSNIIGFIDNVFAGNWSAAWDNIVGIFSNLFGGIVNMAKTPIRAVVGAINGVIDGINSVGFTIPEWVPVIGGKAFSIDIPKIPTFATGGFTDGVSIAGEAGTEAVISFQKAYRKQNLSYWARAGRMLGATADDYTLYGGGGGGSNIDLSGISFAPNITVYGGTKEEILEALREAEGEFRDFLLDLLDEWRRGDYDPEPIAG